MIADTSMLNPRLGLTLVALCVACSPVGILPIQAQDVITIPVRADCPEGGSIPAFLRTKTVDRNFITDIISKTLRCLERTFTKIMNIAMSLVTGFMGCIPKFPLEFLQCINRMDLPHKISDIISSIMTTVKCVTS